MATLIVVALFCLGVGVPARANTTTVSFDFNVLTGNPSDSTISTKLTGQLKTQLGCTLCNVTVTSAAADTTYNGDGHVIGTSSTSTTLATGGNVFLANTNDSSTQLGTSFSIQLTGGVTLFSSASFNYEIFPDGTAQQPPDLTFQVNGTALRTWTAVAPGNLPSPACHAPGASNCGTGSVLGMENNPQLIGASGILTFAPTANPTLTFLDWPSTVGINHLVLNPTPEPGTMLLFGTGLASMFGLKRKKQNPPMQ